MLSSHKIGVLLLNMGGPTDMSGIEPFLKNIFDDPLLLPIKNNMLRKMVGSMIVASRLEYAKANYRAIGGSSPIIAHTFALIKKLQSLDSSRIYSYAMRYAPPFSQNALREFQEKNINDIILFSMYPQYSTTTILSALQDVYSSLKKLDFKPRIRVIEQFYEHEPFYNLVVDSIEKTLDKERCSEYVLVLSAHSIPKKCVEKSGDPYPKQCEQGKIIIKNICEQRGLFFKDIKLAYQSKVGPMRWLTPSTMDILKSLKGEKVIVYPIAFSIDNSETDYELKILYKDLAKKSGIIDYRVCDCLNDSSEFAKMIIELINTNAPLDSMHTKEHKKSKKSSADKKKKKNKTTSSKKEKQ